MVFFTSAGRAALAAASVLLLAGPALRPVAGWTLGAADVGEGQSVRNNFNKVELEAVAIGNPCKSQSGFRQLPFLYSIEVCFSIDSASPCDTLKLQIDTGSSDIWAITDGCQKVQLESGATDCWPVDDWTTEKSCCAGTASNCNRLTEGFYTDVQKDSAHSSGGLKCHDDACLLDAYAVGCTFGETASAFVNITQNRSTNQQRRVGIIDYIANLEESVTVGIAGMSFAPLATFTTPVLIDDYDYFILALQEPGKTSVMYLNIGLDDINVTSASGVDMPFFATNLVPYGGSFQYWLVAMPSMVVGGNDICAGQGCAAVVDSGTSLWTVPSAMWDVFLQAVLAEADCSGDLTSPALGLVTCPGTTYDDFPEIRFWFSSDEASGKGVYQNFTAEQYMVCGVPESTEGACEAGVSTCVLLAEKLDAIGSYSSTQQNFILGDTFFVGRAVVFDVENLQVHMSCLEGEGCVSEAPLTWLQRLWRDWSLVIIIVASGLVVIAFLLVILCKAVGCCDRGKRSTRRRAAVRRRAKYATGTVAQLPVDDPDDPTARYQRLN